VRELNGQPARPFPFAPGIARTFEKVHARFGRQPQQVVHREELRLAHEAVNHEPVLVRIDIRHTGMMTLIDEPARSDRAVQIGERRERRSRARHRPRTCRAAHDVGFVRGWLAIGMVENRRAGHARPRLDAERLQQPRRRIRVRRHDSRQREAAQHPASRRRGGLLRGLRRIDGPFGGKR
jgi:hypothetical protein